MFEYSKVVLNFSRNVSKLLDKDDWCFNKRANHARVMLDNKVPMNSTWLQLVGYQWRWSWTIKHTWLTKPRNFEHVPSNLLDWLIRHLWLGLHCWNASQRGRSLISLQMNHKFTKCLIFLFKILKDNKDFFHRCKHDYEHCVCQSTKKWVICDFLKKIPLKKKGDPHSIPKAI